MHFPYFQFPWLGDPLIIAIDAVLHVYISHGVAIGVLSLIVLAEWLGTRGGGEHWERLARSAIKPAVIVITGVGAVTGVGIWFITSALVPVGIGSMLRVFFWPWFIEWVVFFAEVAVILIYYFTWDSWTGAAKKWHVRLGVLYIFLAFASAFLITGILGFMLTSDGWPRDRGFWGAFFNPTFLPQLFWRLAIGLVMGCLFLMAYVLFARWPAPDFRRRATRLLGKALALPLIAMPVFGLWWIEMVPMGFRTHARPALLIWTFSYSTPWFYIVHALCGLLVLAVLVAAVRGSIVGSRIVVVPAILMVLFFVAEYERVREFIRGPYLMPGYMYANTLLLAEHDLYSRQGLAARSWWYARQAAQPTEEQEGQFLFAANCGTCHTIGGKNDIRDRLRGRTERGVYVLIGRTEQMIPWMPPFTGSERERASLARFIHRLTADRYRLSGEYRYPASGKEGVP